MPHKSLDPTGGCNEKNGKSRVPSEGNFSKNNTDGYRGRSQSPTKDNFSPIKQRKHSKRRKKRKRKRIYSSSLSATSATPDSDLSDNEPAIKKFKLVSVDEWYKYKISKSRASFANEDFELYLPDKEPHSNILKERKPST